MDDGITDILVSFDLLLIMIKPNTILIYNFKEILEKVKKKKLSFFLIGYPFVDSIKDFLLK